MDIGEIIGSLKKRVNASTIPEKTMERTREIWTSFKHVQKQETLALAGVTAATAHNTYKKGHISAPLAISMAQVAGINPGYLTGHAATRGRFNEKSVKSFLLANGYALPAGLTGEDESAAEPAFNAAAEEETCDCVCGDCSSAALLGGEPLALLLQALVIKAGFCDTAKATLCEVQNLLLQ